jgi:translation initiation factor 2 subunit 1
MPAWGEIVLCTVKRITPYAAWTNLTEYPGVEGMIHVSEVAGKWVRDIRDFVKNDKEYIAKVVRIDYQKGFINLSLKRVSEFDKREKMNAFRRDARADKMLEQTAKELGKSLDQAYEEVGYALQERCGNLFAAFEEIKKSPDDFKDIPNEWLEALRKVAERSFKEKESVIKANLQLRSFASDGIEKVKSLLLELKKTGDVRYVSAGNYRIEVKTKEPKTAEKELVQALDTVAKQVKDGECNYKLVK